MSIDWVENVKHVGATLLFVTMWVAAWGIVEHLVDKCIASEKHRIIAYVVLLVCTSVILLLAGQDLTIHS
jgi:CHASE2 domain-containing sensor protein